LDVYSYESFHEHELIHAYLAPFGAPPSLFQEGIAVTLACDAVELPAFSTLMSWREAVALNDPTGADVYVTGSILVNHLLASYGPEPFLRLYSELLYRSSPEAVDAAMQRIYGATADDIWAAAMARPRGCIPIGRCARPEIATDGTPVPADGQCGLDVDRRTLAVAAQTNVVIATDLATSYKLDSCERSIPSFYLPNATQACSPNLLLADLAPGRYFLEFATGASKLAVTVPAVPALGPTCDGTAALAVPDGTHDLSIRPFTGETELAKDFFVKLRFDTTASVHFFPLSLGRVSACAGCDRTTPDCQRSDASSGVALPSVGDSTLLFNYFPSNYESGPDHADVLIGKCEAVP
jgi:hypothetical protein